MGKAWWLCLPRKLAALKVTYVTTESMAGISHVGDESRSRDLSLH